MYNVGNMIKVEIPKNKQEKIKEFIPEIIKEKMNEKQYKKDYGSIFKRWYTGLMGEAAIEELLNIPVLDFSIGHSDYYNNPDIDGYSIGVKTVEYGSYPLIPFNNDYSQIFCIKYFNTIFVSGLATPDVLNTYQSEEFINSKKLKNLHKKTCFTGFEHLINI